ncbi:MAG: hypothetical protein KC561_20465, partial [Myxococcales bacterium]|nr:hypothetical protein [Myxococcales bacterium]
MNRQQFERYGWPFLAGLPKPPERLMRYLYWGAVGLVTFVWFLGCFHGIANFWQWGHDGFNGAAFAHAARNSIRFGIAGQVQYYMGLEAPGVEMVYTHHPMMLHFHLMTLFRLFGYSEWVARLTPAVYSFL